MFFIWNYNKLAKNCAVILTTDYYFSFQKFEIVSKPRQYEDTRSIDELLAFINGGDEGIFSLI